MPSLELEFIPDDTEPTDEQLLLQLVYGLSNFAKNQREERCMAFVSAVDIPNPYMRRLIKLLVARLNLPIPVERVDEFIRWRQTNHCWIVSEEMGAEAKRLMRRLR